MRHLDLFSGIGGFALAADRVWPEIEHIFCDNDLFCQEVLRKHWPDSKIYGDIRTITDTTSDRRREGSATSLQEGHQEEPQHSRELEGGFERPYLLTGGFPCQPFSQAGRRRGTEDDRYLWPEMLRVIQLTKPTWIIGENVGGFITWNEGLVLQQVCLDLEGEGYEVQPFIIPAVSVNAPHRRDRVWVVANRECAGRGTRNRQKNDRGEWKIKKSYKERDFIRNYNGTDGGTGWGQNWLEVATRLCRVDDGLPRRMDRNPRLKALGNAIVSQVAEEIMKGLHGTT